MFYIRTAIIPEDLDTSEELSHSAADDSMSSTISSNSNSMKLPVEEDFDYIKQISNGAYGYVCVSYSLGFCAIGVVSPVKCSTNIYYMYL